MHANALLSLQLIREYDLDHNGQLDRIEFRTFARAKFNIDAVAADAIFTRIDDDRNGQISAKELHDHCHVLVGFDN